MNTVQRYFAGELRPDQEQSWLAEDGIFVKHSKYEEDIEELKVELHKYKSYYFARLGKLLKEDTP